MRDGFCTVHHPTEGQDMQALGRKGGRVSPLTKLRLEAVDELRASARDVLARVLRGEQVDREQLAAARSLFSYRSDAPPVAEKAQSQTAGKPFYLGDIINLAIEHGILVLHGTLEHAGNRTWMRP